MLQMTPAIITSKWGSLFATDRMALVSDLMIRKAVFSVRRSGASATGFIAERLPHEGGSQTKRSPGRRTWMALKPWQSHGVSSSSFPRHSSPCYNFRSGEQTDKTRNTKYPAQVSQEVGRTPPSPFMTPLKHLLQVAYQVRRLHLMQRYHLVQGDQKCCLLEL